MRWLIEKPVISQGDRRTVLRFAWVRTKVNDDSTVVWLEFYREIQQYIVGQWTPVERKTCPSSTSRGPT